MFFNMLPGSETRSGLPIQTTTFADGLAISGDGVYLAICLTSTKRVVEIYKRSGSSWNKIQEIPSPNVNATDFASNMAFSRDASRLAIQSKNELTYGAIYIYDKATTGDSWVFRLRIYDSVNMLDFNKSFTMLPDGSKVLAGETDNLYMLDAATGSLLTSFSHGTSQLCLSMASDRIVYSSIYGSANLYQLDALKRGKIKLVASAITSTHTVGVAEGLVPVCSGNGNVVSTVWKEGSTTYSDFWENVSSVWTQRNTLTNEGILALNLDGTIGISTKLFPTSTETGSIYVKSGTSWISSQQHGVVQPHKAAMSSDGSQIVLLAPDRPHYLVKNGLSWIEI